MKKEIGLLFVAAVLLAAQCKKEPIAEFSFQDNTKAKSPVYFTNNSQYNNSCYWDFGDTETSTSQSPSHAYQKPGTYTVTLTVNGEGGEDTRSKSIHITGTTYSVKNNCTFKLYTVVSYYWDGNNVKDYTEHGTLDPTEETETILTNRNQIDVAFTSSDGTLCLVFDTYGINSGSHNTLIITGDTYVYCDDKKCEQNFDPNKALLFEKLKGYIEKSSR